MCTRTHAHRGSGLLKLPRTLFGDIRFTEVSELIIMASHQRKKHGARNDRNSIQTDVQVGSHKAHAGPWKNHVWVFLMKCHGFQDNAGSCPERHWRRRPPLTRHIPRAALLFQLRNWIIVSSRDGSTLIWILLLIDSYSALGHSPPMVFTLEYNNSTYSTTACHGVSRQITGTKHCLEDVVWPQFRIHDRDRFRLKSPHSIWTLSYNAFWLVVSKMVRTSWEFSSCGVLLLLMKAGNS